MFWNFQFCLTLCQSLEPKVRVIPHSHNKLPLHEPDPLESNAKSSFFVHVRIDHRDTIKRNLDGKRQRKPRVRTTRSMIYNAAKEYRIMIEAIDVS